MICGFGCYGTGLGFRLFCCLCLTVAGFVAACVGVLYFGAFGCVLVWFWWFRDWYVVCF